MSRAIWLLAAVLVVTLSVRFYMKTRPPAGSSPAPVIVGVEGEVSSPGVYLLKGNPIATVGQALDAAGGVRAGCPAGPASKLLTKEVKTGQKVWVECLDSRQLEVRMEDMSAAARLTVGLKLDINTASEEDLFIVPHMKPELASAIVQRRSRQLWKRIEDLCEVPGIGPKTAEKLKEYLQVSNAVH